MTFRNRGSSLTFSFLLDIYVCNFNAGGEGRLNVLLNCSLPYEQRILRQTWLPLLNDKPHGEKRSREGSLLLLVWLGRQVVAINMNSERTSHWGSFAQPLLPWKRNSMSPFCCCRRCSCQQYKNVQWCHGNATMGLLFTSVTAY